MKVKLLKYYNLDEKLFVFMSLFLFVVSVLSIIGNVIVGLDPVVNYKWIALIGICVITIHAAIKKKKLLKYQVILFFLSIFVFLPSGWITSGGINEFTSAYTLLICLVMCLILKGKTRMFFVASELLVLISMILLEQHRPELLYQNVQDVMFADRLFQLPLTMIALAGATIVFSNAFRKERILINDHIEKIKNLNMIISDISTVDSITGTNNKHGIERKLNNIKNGIIKDDNTFVMMLSLGGFKDIIINDGYVLCNKILLDIGKMLEEVVEKRGFIGRYFADEFIIIHESSDFEEVKRFALEIEKRVSSDRIKANTAIIRMNNSDSNDEIITKLESIIRGITV